VKRGTRWLQPIGSLQGRKVIAMAATLIVLLSGIAILVGLVVYRLIFSPLAVVPGPNIAALTGWYEFYWDCLKSGKYMFVVEEMHRKYGMVLVKWP
jgi:hypothetical protein